ncbi:hypothetical protein RYX36_026572 [Vicia faba]
MVAAVFVGGVIESMRRWSSANGDVASAWSTSVMRGSKTEAVGDSGEDAVGSDIAVGVVYEDGSKSSFCFCAFFQFLLFFPQARTYVNNKNKRVNPVVINLD